MIRMIKEWDRNVVTTWESVQRRWKEHFEAGMKEEKERERRVEEMEIVEQEFGKIS